MTRKDLQLIADALKDARRPFDALANDDLATAQRTHKAIALYLADALATNPRFNRARFLAACGVED